MFRLMFMLCCGFSAHLVFNTDMYAEAVLVGILAFIVIVVDAWRDTQKGK